MTNLMDFPKALGARLDYGIEWKDWLGSGESIASSVWTVSPATGLTVLTTHVNKGTQAVVWVEGGIAGKAYTLTNTITTNQVDTTTGLPRVNSRSLGIFVRPL